jgi:hypothetical protein
MRAAAFDAEEQRPDRLLFTANHVGKLSDRGGTIQSRKISARGF